MLRRPSIFLLINVIYLLCSFIWIDVPLGKIASILEQFRQKFPQEKTYLQLDRNYYVAGDTLNFKAYVVNAENNQPSVLSKVLYVELANVDGTNTAALRFPIEEGTASGTLEFPDTLKEGNYVLRAYTNWMKNFEQDFFYHTNIKIGNAINDNIFCSSTINYDKDNHATASVLFKALDNGTFDNKTISYTIGNNDKVLTKGEATTNSSGEININLPELAPGQTVFLSIDVPLRSNQSFKKTFHFKTPKTLHSIQFFPEGGNLVDQLISVVGFKATGNNGKGEKVYGTITDETGKVLTTFQPSFAGMGRFSLTPSLAHHYYSLIKYKDGTIQKTTLPDAAASGYVLTVNNFDKNDLIVKINHNGPQVPGSVLLVAQANNKLISSIEIRLTGNAAVVSLSRRKFPTGIVQFTLFDPSGQPKAERLTFVDRHDQLRLNVSFQEDRPVGPTLKMTLDVKDQLLNPVSGNFSVAIVDQSTAPDSSAKMPSILASLLLTSDLKGNIEDPNYYFTEQSPKAAMALDDLLLTQGWRRFMWKDLLDGKYPKTKYPIEKNLTLSGLVESLKELAVPGGKVFLIAKGNRAFTLDTITDSNGRFTFDLPDLTGQQQFTIIASTATGNKNVEVKVDQDITPKIVNFTDQNSSLDIRLFDYLSLRQQYPNPINRSNHQLKEVTIRSKKTSPADQAVAASRNLNGPGNADQIVTYQDLNNCTDLEMCLQGKLNGVFFKSVIDPNSKIYIKVPYSVIGMNKPMLIVLDGVALPANQASLNSIPARDVQSIEVLRTGSHLVAYGTDGSGGVLVITTKTGGIDYNKINEPKGKSSNQMQGAVFATYNGYHASREFYIPAFNVSFPQKDRSLATIFWKPVVKTNDEGKAIIEFPVGSNVKKFLIIVEGLSADGKIGYKYNEQTIK